MVKASPSVVLRELFKNNDLVGTPEDKARKILRELSLAGWELVTSEQRRALMDMAAALRSFNALDYIRNEPQ